MLDQVARHGGLDLTVRTRGLGGRRTPHRRGHLAGVRTGTARGAGDKAGVTRYGNAMIPLDEALTLCVVDLSGRPYLVHEEPELVELIGTYDTTLTRHIFESIVATANITVHVKVVRAQRPSHRRISVQGIRAGTAAGCDARPRLTGIPSTKGTWAHDIGRGPRLRIGQSALGPAGSRSRRR